MHFKSFFTTFLAGMLLLLSTVAFAKYVPVQQAETVARNFFFSRYQQYLEVNKPEAAAEFRASDIRFSEVIPVKQSGHVLAWVFNRDKQQGYIVIAADDKAFPVLNYAFSGSLNPKAENLPDGLQWFLNSYYDQIQRAIEEDLQPLIQTERAWQDYASANVKSQVKGQTPMTDSIPWDQGCFYNAQCPVDNSSGLCNHVPVGCVATAMGIVMKYHQYPSHGTGQETYNSNYGQLSANFSNTIYKWDLMPNELTSHNAEVAQLLSHLGIAINMNYTASGSGALFGHSYYTPTAETALQDHFGYNNADWADKSSYTLGGWQNRLLENLDSLNPVLYAGGVHAFVCDGYQGSSNNHFHFNWGWGGMYNSYCYLNSIVPGGTGTGGGTGNYTSNQQAIFDVAPPKTSPLAEFVANTTTISPGGDIFFTDLTDYVPTSWHWDFGDGNSSNQQFPVHSYNATGTYNVKLVVSNSYGADSVLKSSYITVQNNSSSINADIYTVVDTAFVSDLISFSDVSSGNPTAWTWDFDDGNYSNVNTPKHAYSQAGTYDVKLTAANSNGSDTTSVQVVILPAPVPTADFEADTVAVAAGTNAKFYDLSVNQPYSWDWHFGDGGSSSYQNPTYKYQTPGTYSVKLVVSNAYGLDSILKQNYITVYQSAPVANFIASKTTVLDGQNIQFIDQSQGVVDSYNWDFGDGNTSTSAYPTHAYATPGIYSVSLTVTNAAGSDTEIKTDMITVNGSSVTESHKTQFNVYPNPVTDKMMIDFNDVSGVHGFRLTDMSGKTVFSKINPQKQETINLSHLSSGLYLLEVVQENNTSRQKIVIH